MAAHALNGLVGSVDNVGGTLKANKEYTLKFPAPDAFLDDIAKAGKGHKKIDHRGTKAFPGIPLLSGSFSQLPFLLKKPGYFLFEALLFF